jgi:hypothetical protein
VRVAEKSENLNGADSAPIVFRELLRGGWT